MCHPFWPYGFFETLNKIGPVNFALVLGSHPDDDNDSNIHTDRYFSNFFYGLLWETDHHFVYNHNTCCILSRDMKIKTASFHIKYVKYVVLGFTKV